MDGQLFRLTFCKIALYNKVFKRLYREFPKERRLRNMEYLIGAAAGITAGGTVGLTVICLWRRMIKENRADASGKNMRSS